MFKGWTLGHVIGLFFIALPICYLLVRIGTSAYFASKRDYEVSNKYLKRKDK